eukprot:GHVQ01014335.1.p1 GENE.GHVQ01014335.1~~GHVQ01014335.1.p1  ORF type:complete len:284 (-),score=38.95 GHVQ01014335.1:255-1106(-)
MGCFVAVPQDHVYLVETCGNFSNMAGPGFNCIGVPGICAVGGKVNMRISQIVVPVETKTNDNVFVMFLVAVQYQVKRDKVYEAFYTLQDPVKQIQSYVFDVVRASVPKLNLDDVFASKDEIATDVRTQLRQEMGQYGFEIRDALVVDVTPDTRVRVSMNEINANKRLRMAAVEKAEAEKVRIVKDAEAEAESKYLQGFGLARQRKAIIDGLRDNVTTFSTDTKVDSKSAMDLVLVTQYFDTIQNIAKDKRTTVVYYQDEPGEAQSQFLDSIRTSIQQGTIKID